MDSSLVNAFAVRLNHHIETSQFIFHSNQINRFYMRGKLDKIQFTSKISSKPKKAFTLPALRAQCKEVAYVFFKCS